MNDLEKVRNKLELAIEPTRSKKHGGSGGRGGSEPPMDNSGELNQRVTHIESALSELKTDISGLKDSINGLAVSVAEMDAKLDIGSIRQIVERSHTDIYKWAATVAISVVGLGFAVYSGLKQNASPAAQQQAPIIINVPSAAPSAQAPPPPPPPAQTK